MINATVVGRLGGDAEKKKVKDAKVLAFSIASQRGKDSETSWVRCSWWGDGAAKVAEYLTKGRRVAVAGDMRVTQKDGKTYLDLRVSSLELLGDGKPAQNGKDERDASADW